MVATHFFGKRYKNRVFEDFEKPDFLGKNGGTTSCPFQGPPKFGCKFFLGLFLFFFFFFLFLLHLARGCVKKNPIFIGFFAHPSKASSDIMQQQ